jgi:hypothetical protein
MEEQLLATCLGRWIKQGKIGGTQQEHEDSKEPQVLLARKVNKRTIQEFNS